MTAASKQETFASRAMHDKRKIKIFPKVTSPFKENQALPDKRDYLNTASATFDSCVWPGGSLYEK